jgi:hypothetical protein
MKLRPILFLFTLIIMGSLPAQAIPFTLDFGGLQNNEQVLSFYDGGTGSLGSGPGTNYGVSFNPTFVAVFDVPPYGPDIVGQANGLSLMNVNGGFNLLSFYYESPDSGSVYIMSGLNGAGATLAVIPLAGSATWSAEGTGFGGTALSVVFNVASGTKFDQITDVNFVIPEPSSLLLLATGLVSLIPECRKRLTRRMTQVYGGLLPDSP